MEINIGDRIIGKGHPIFIIAEAGINHNKDKSLAKELIGVAAECGANAVKFQTWKTEEFIANKEVTYQYREDGRMKEESMYEMFKRLELPVEWHKELFDYARVKGIIPLSSPADHQAVDLLEELGVPAFKLASEDLINIPLVEYVAGKGKTVILSTGMATEDEIRMALKCFDSPASQVVLLHCVSLYPTPLDLGNLNRIVSLREKFNVPAGYSDHTDGTLAAIGAVSLGAVLIEKHFTIDKNLQGPDHSFSADPTELKIMVDNIRLMENAIGSGEIRPSEAEWAMRDSCRRSVVADTDIKKGMVITKDMIHFRRPGTGLKPIEIDLVVGKRAKVDILYNDKITFEMIE